MPPSHEDLLKAVETNSRLVQTIIDKQELFALALGHVPNSDGLQGSGLLGSVAKLERQVQGFLDLQNTGRGFLFSLKIFGLLIIGGIAYWITNLFESPKS